MKVLRKGQYVVKECWRLHKDGFVCLVAILRISYHFRRMYTICLILSKDRINIVQILLLICR